MLPSLLVLLACGPADRPADGPHEGSRPDDGVASSPVDTAAVDGPVDNVLLILLDDVGVDNVGVYGVAPDPPPTPTIDALAAEGVLFRWAYASPMCSPTRANILTGRHARRTGLGHLVQPHSGYELPRDELGLGELVANSPHGWSSSMVGKWHLSDAHRDDAPTHPAAFGFDWYAGSLENLLVTAATIEGKSYWRWEKNDNGALSVRETYATVDTTDDAIARAAAMPEPWLLYVAYNAAHMPWHVPPAELHTLDVAADDPDHLKYDAMVESVDAEIGRLLGALDPAVRARTTVIVMGDNGTPDQVITDPFDPLREKGTVFEGGVRVPLIVAGPHVSQPGSETDALVHAVDLFATVADLAEVPLDGPDAPPFAGPIDGVSLLPWLAEPSLPSGREHAFAEWFLPVGTGAKDTDISMIHDGTWKLMRRDGVNGVTDMLFRLVDDGIDEGPDLLAEPDLLDDEAREAHARLGAALEQQLATLSSE